MARRLFLAYPLCAACALAAILLRDGIAPILGLVWLAYCALVAVLGPARGPPPGGGWVGGVAPSGGVGGFAGGGGPVVALGPRVAPGGLCAHMALPFWVPLH